MTTKEIARTLATITEEQWEAILTTSKHVTAFPFVQELSKVDSEGEKKTEIDLRLRISNLIKKIGVPPHIRGYSYLQDAVMLAYEDETYIHNVTKRLYPIIAEIHQTTDKKVERAIRTAFETAYIHGDPQVLDDVFKTGDNRPGNSHAIAALVECIKMYN